MSSMSFIKSSLAATTVLTLVSFNVSAQSVTENFDNLALGAWQDNVATHGIGTTILSPGGSNIQWSGTGLSIGADVAGDNSLHFNATVPGSTLALSFKLNETSDIDISYLLSSNTKAPGTLSVSGFGSGATTDSGPSFDTFNAGAIQDHKYTSIGPGQYTFTMAAPVSSSFSADPAVDNLKIILTPSVPSIPEPETYALMLGGLGALVAVARRRRPLR